MRTLPTYVPQFRNVQCVNLPQGDTQLLQAMLSMQGVAKILGKPRTCHTTVPIDCTRGYVLNGQGGRRTYLFPFCCRPPRAGQTAPGPRRSSWSRRRRRRRCRRRPRLPLPSTWVQVVPHAAPDTLFADVPARVRSTWAFSRAPP